MSDVQSLRGMSGRSVLAALVASVILSACGGAAATGGSAASGTAAGATPAASPGRDVRSPAQVVGTPVAGSAPVAGRPWYLALGDSITFGYTRDPARAGVNSSWALQLQPLLAAAGRPWTLDDLACTGEDTHSYVTGCTDRHRPPQLATVSQRQAALDVIRSHGADLKLILVDLGSNDLLHAAARSGISASTAATATASMIADLRTILSQLSAAAPGVPIIVATLYNPLALLRPDTVPLIAEANRQLVALVASLHLEVTDFATAVNGADGTSPQMCLYVDCAHLDIHPTVAGHALLARTALASVMADTRA